MQNAVYPGRRPVAIPRDRPVILRYRIVLHRGELTPADIQRLQAAGAGAFLIGESLMREADIEAKLRELIGNL